MKEWVKRLGRASASPFKNDPIFIFWFYSTLRKIMKEPSPSISKKPSPPKIDTPVSITFIDPVLAIELANKCIPTSGLPDENQDIIRQANIRHLSRLLEGHSVPTIDLDRMCTKIQNTYYKSLIEGFSPVGSWAASAISQKLQQQTLNTFHQAGASHQVSNALIGWKKILAAAKDEVPTRTMFSFRNPEIDILGVVLSNRKLAELTFASIITESAVVNAEDISSESKWWYRLYNKLFNFDLERVKEQKYVLRIVVNRNLMYRNHIDTLRLARIIETDSIICIPSPDSIGELHVYANDKKGFSDVINTKDIPSLSIEELTRIFLYVVDGKIKETLVKGIKGVMQIYPRAISVWSCVKRVDKVKENTYRIYPERFMFNRYNISMDKLIVLCRYVGMKVVGYFASTNSIQVECNPSPDELIEIAEKKEKKEDDEFDEKLKAGLVPHSIRPSSEYGSKSTHLQAEVDGGNMTELMKRPEIDPHSIYSDSVSEVYNRLGICAARNQIILYLSNLNADTGSDVDHVHIELIASTITFLGVPTPVTYSGIFMQETGAISKAGFERVVDQMAGGASMGSKDPVTNSTAAITAGVAVKMGTGGVVLLPDNKALPKMRREDLLKELDMDPPESIREKETPKKLGAPKAVRAIKMVSKNLPDAISESIKSKSPPEKSLYDAAPTVISNLSGKVYEKLTTPSKGDPPLSKLPLVRSSDKIVPKELIEKLENINKDHIHPIDIPPVEYMAKEESIEPPSITPSQEKSEGMKEEIPPPVMEDIPVSITISKDDGKAKIPSSLTSINPYEITKDAEYVEYEL